MPNEEYNDDLYVVTESTTRIWALWLLRVTIIFTVPHIISLSDLYSNSYPVKSIWIQYHESRNNSSKVMTIKNTKTNLMMLLCLFFALISCLFPFSTLSVVSNASSYSRSVTEACELSWVISSLCKEEISRRAFSAVLRILIISFEMILYLIQSLFESFYHWMILLL